jgi:hypothetical protein
MYEKTNKYTNYSFSLLIMYCSSYMFRHYVVILRERSLVPSAFWEMLNWGAVDRILWMGVLCLVTWCTRYTLSCVCYVEVWYAPLGTNQASTQQTQNNV